MPLRESNDDSSENVGVSEETRSHTAFGGLSSSLVSAQYSQKGLAREAVWAYGSDKPEVAEVHVGFMPLADCAPLIGAAEMGLDRKYGIKIVLERESSWANIRDKLAAGVLHSAHLLYGIAYGMHLGIGGPQTPMAILMNLNCNGQAITLSNRLKSQGVTNAALLKRAIKGSPLGFTFAHTFPTGTHAMWLNYWLAAMGVNPLTEVRAVTVPPPQMLAHLRSGQIDGYCAGEPWGSRAIVENVGFTWLSTGEIWPDHPDKVLACSEPFVKNNPHSSRALIMAVLEAARFIDLGTNHSLVSRILARKSCMDMPRELIANHLSAINKGYAKKVRYPLKFFSEGVVSFPYLSDGMWFMTQLRRWGMLPLDIDYLSIANQVHQLHLYTEAAQALNVALPGSPLRSSRLIDGVCWDGRAPKDYAEGFAISAAS